MQRTQGAYYDLLPYRVASWGTPQFYLFVNYHSYIHVFITEGGQDKKGKLHKVSDFDDSLIAESFSREIFSLLLREKPHQPGTGAKGKAIENYNKFLDLRKDADPGIAEVEHAKKRLAGLRELH